MPDIDPAIVDAVATLLRRQVVLPTFFAPYLGAKDDVDLCLQLHRQDLVPLELAGALEVKAAIRALAARPGRARFLNADRVLERLRAWRTRYPESVFEPVKPGELLDPTCRVGPHMARHVLDLLAAELEAEVHYPELDQLAEPP